ncbi:MAG TPA: hypothetical protein VKB21_05140 [Candidatus Acidoferrum sp.]|nr:hypothetical protein [Candidatus Acidoferrum sp.]
MKSYVTFRRHPFDEVVPRSNEDPKTWEVVPYGKLGAGLWTGHPAGLIVVIGTLIVGWVGIPEWRYFFGATVLVGSLVAYSFYRRHRVL